MMNISSLYYNKRAVSFTSLSSIMSKILFYLFHEIHLIQRQITLDFDNQTSLLNFLEQHQIHHEYQCRSGYCGSCRVKIKKGKVSYAEAPLAFIQPDEILLCCCRVESDLEIEL